MLVVSKRVAHEGATLIPYPVESSFFPAPVQNQTAVAGFCMAIPCNSNVPPCPPMCRQSQGVNIYLFVFASHFTPEVEEDSHFDIFQEMFIKWGWSHQLGFNGSFSSFFFDVPPPQDPADVFGVRDHQNWWNGWIAKRIHRFPLHNTFQIRANSAWGSRLRIGSSWNWSNVDEKTHPFTGGGKGAGGLRKRKKDESVAC